MGANIPMEGKRMKHSSSLPKAMALVLMVMVGVAVMASSDSTGKATTQPGLVAPAEFTACDDPGFMASQADGLTAVVLENDRFAPEPVAICRLLPQCWVNSDCDAQCGAGLGKCVHSNCPVRICRCR
jgi:hypothetical protein